MNIETRRALARWIGILSAVTVTFCTGYLVFSDVQSRQRAVLDKVLVEFMEEAVKMDADVSVKLTAERERQTKRSLEQSTRNGQVATVLTIGAALFLAAVNWGKSLEKEPVLPLVKLQRFRQASSSHSRAPESVLWSLETAERPQIDLSYVEDIVKQEGTTTDAAIPVLRAIQVRYGFLPDDALKRVCELTDITPAQIAGTSSFYAQFRRSPIGKHLVKICHGTACHVSGAVQVTEELRRFLSIAGDADTDPSHFFTLEKVACLGCCSLAPVMMVDDQTIGRLTPAHACHALHDSEEERSA